MSLNEQLAEAGLLEAFDEAITARDRPTLDGIGRQGIGSGVQIATQPPSEGEPQQVE